jgi:hypothetical protein
MECTEYSLFCQRPKPSSRNPEEISEDEAVKTIKIIKTTLRNHERQDGNGEPQLEQKEFTFGCSQWLLNLFSL